MITCQCDILRRHKLGKDRAWVITCRHSEATWSLNGNMKLGCGHRMRKIKILESKMLASHFWQGKP